MSTAKAIVISAVVLGVAIVAAVTIATFFGGRDPVGERYQISRIEGNQAWRMDRQTGATELCRLDGSTVICADSRAPLDDYRAPTRLPTGQQDRDVYIMERFFDFFREIFWMILAIEREKDADPPAQTYPTGEPQRG